MVLLQPRFREYGVDICEAKRRLILGAFRDRSIQRNSNLPGYEQRSQTDPQSMGAVGKRGCMLSGLNGLGNLNLQAAPAAPADAVGDLHTSIPATGTGSNSFS